MTVPISERELQDAIVQAARLYGYRVFHSRPARTNKGWRTPVAYDGAGFPDLVLVGRGRVIFAELKSDRGRLTPEQEEWKTSLRDAGHVLHVWRPSDWPNELLRVLAPGVARVA